MSESPDYKAICQSTLGGELLERECQVLATIMEVHRLRDGEVLVEEGQPDSRLFLLAEGKLEVLSNVDGAEAVVYTMTRGECAGTRAFVDRTPRKAKLRAEGEAAVYSLKPESFESLMETQPRIVYKVMRSLFRITHANLMRMNQESRELANYITKSHGRY